MLLIVPRPGANGDRRYAQGGKMAEDHAGCNGVGAVGGSLAKSKGARDCAPFSCPANYAAALSASTQWRRIRRTRRRGRRGLLAGTAPVISSRSTLRNEPACANSRDLQ